MRAAVDQQRMDRVSTGILCGHAGGDFNPTRPPASGIDSAALDQRIALLEARALLTDRGDGRAVIHPSLRYTIDGLARLLPARLQLEVTDRVASTNARGRTATGPSPPRLGIIVAREQAGGRGRYDRVWHSPRGGIWTSVVDLNERQPTASWHDQLAMSVATTDVAAALGLDARLKWPNDVVGPDGGKLAGVLVEATTAGGRIERTVVGVGLNANIDPAVLPAGATSLMAHLGVVSLAPVAGYLLTSFLHRRQRPAATIDAWRRASHTLGREVVVSTPQGDLTGIATDIDANGSLRLETDDTAHTISPDRCRRLRYTDVTV